MSNRLWIHHESGCGGRLNAELSDEQFLAGSSNLVEYYVRTEVYVHWLRSGYDMDWRPPEWILALYD
ncbi:hypothetical protein [Herbiconiux daphne]|uniref:Uncharacterized protein n=1 Tax=Herbiconiux daphne TaxID=2970914 RepID=A0ABT2HC68_9MICO|nr:hypothetical protein [Herbiconiux daphne]MCS5737483.1 hypothetical protein [Herbiconiux daphne]